ncbi:MAG: membrane dipeptidase, partial [Gemmatimonadota bacterium]|nr:membrane dipeptidase [Gemmatimonadota bacterium]
AYKKLTERFHTGMQNILEQFPVPDVTDFVDHIDHVVKLIGIDHAGIGSDFGGGGGLRLYDNAAQAVNVTAELLRRGYSEQDIEKIWGGNFLRVWEQVERVAAELRAGNTNRQSN